jgi:hypothetical protein
MAFKTTVKNQRLSHFVASSARSFAGKVQENLAGKLLGLLREGEILPDFKLLQELVGRFLEERGTQLLEADDRYSSDRVIARELRLDRVEQTRQLTLRLREARQLFDRLGKERSEAVLPRRAFSKLSAAELIREANQAATILRDPERAGARVASVGASSQTELLEGLEADARLLQEVLDRQEGLQARKKQLGLEEKSKEIAETELAIRAGASLLTGLYTFADLPFHAQRIRRRVSSRKAEKPEEGEMEGMTIGAPDSPELTEEVIARLD